MQNPNAILQNALRHWNAAKTLVGQKRSTELFEDIVDVDELMRSIDPRRQPDKALAVLAWIYNYVDNSEVYKNQIINISFDRALDALTIQQVSAFYSNLEYASKFDPELNGLLQKVRRLSESMIRAIVRETALHPIGRAIKEVRNEMFPTVVLRAVLAFANSDLPYDFQPHHVRIVIDDVLDAVTEDLRN